MKKIVWVLQSLLCLLAVCGSHAQNGSKKIMAPDWSYWSGADTVCGGVPENFHFKNTVAHTRIGWKADCGIVYGDTYGDDVTVVFGAKSCNGFFGLRIWREQLGNSTLVSDTVYKKIFNATLAYTLKGDSIAQCNTYGKYSIDYEEGDFYKWSVYPKDAGSIVSGNDTAVVTVFWNNTDEDRVVYLKMATGKCQLYKNDRFAIVLKGQKEPVVTAKTTCAILPDATFDFDDVSCGENAIRFYAKNQAEGNHYLWEFGDRTSSTHPSPTKMYPIYGDFYPKLTLTDRFGCVSKPAIKPLRINSMPSDGVLLSPEAVVAGESTELQFLSTANGLPPVKFEWMKGHEIVGTTTVPRFKISSAGRYWVRVFDRRGCSRKIMPPVSPLFLKR
ncbi:MAG: PKD domain-containing protein [Burkholderiales bacterium]|nr:PKD domain-containing protein [Flavobacterium sp.]